MGQWWDNPSSSLPSQCEADESQRWERRGPYSCPWAGSTECFFAALEWAAPWQVHIIHFINWAGGYAGSEKGVFNVECRMEMGGRWRKPFHQELPVQTSQMEGDPCFFGLAPHLGTGFYVLVSEPGWRRLAGCFILGLQDCKSWGGERSYCPLFGTKHKICSTQNSLVWIILLLTPGVWGDGGWTPYLTSSFHRGGLFFVLFFFLNYY